MMQNDTLWEILPVISLSSVNWSSVLKLPLELSLSLGDRIYHRSGRLWVKVVILFYWLKLPILFGGLTWTSFITLRVIVGQSISSTSNKLCRYSNGSWSNTLIRLLKEDKAFFSFSPFILPLHLKLFLLEDLLVWSSDHLSTLVSQRRLHKLLIRQQFGIVIPWILP